MKDQPLIIAALGVVVVILWMQGRQTATEVNTLRAQQQVLTQTNAPTQRTQTDPMEPPEDSTRPAPLSPTEDLTVAHARIAELERDLGEVVDALNAAIERINRSTVEAERARQPAWGVGQAVGEPDTMTAGDQRTAWAPATSDGGSEWLQLGYENAVEIAQVRVRETCGAGSIAKVAAILEGGREVVIWQGRHAASEGIVDAPFNAPAGLTARSVKVYLDTARVPGWNEIDAVELVGRDGTRQWAKTSAASSSYSGAGALSDFGPRTRLNLDFTGETLSR